jgi:hypothetical protein
MDQTNPQKIVAVNPFATTTPLDGNEPAMQVLLAIDLLVLRINRVPPRISPQFLLELCERAGTSTDRVLKGLISLAECGYLRREGNNPKYPLAPHRGEFFTTGFLKIRYLTTEVFDTTE